MFSEREKRQAQERMLLANQYTQQELKYPQMTILFLTKQLIDTCEEKHRETLEAIQHGTNLMHLHVQNFTDLQLIKFNAFKAENKVLRLEEAVKDVIKMHSAAAKMSFIEIVFDNETSKVDSRSPLPSKVLTDAERVIQVL